MKLLIVTFDPPERAGGIENRARIYAEKITRKGNFVEIVSFENASFYVKKALNSIMVHRLPSDPLKSSYSLRKFIHIAFSFQNIFILTGSDTLSGFLVCLYSKISRKRVVSFLYGKDILSARKKIYRFLFMILSCLISNKVASNSRFTMLKAPSFLRKKISVIYPGVEVESSFQNNDDEKVILFVGRLVERKGLFDLLKAFSFVLRKFPDSRLEIVGDGPERDRLEAFAEEIGISGKVFFRGELRGDDLKEAYRRCSIFTCPSKETKWDAEGFGTVFLEAAVFSKPSVATNSGGIPEAVVNGETGILVKPGDIGELANSLILLLQDQEKRRFLGSKGRERAIKYFTWDVSSEKLLELFSR
jgi:phosphatidylinositol alpha-1,6-mannosyltransferase